MSDGGEERNTDDVSPPGNVADSSAPSTPSAPGPLKSLLFTLVLLVLVGAAVEGLARILTTDENPHSAQVRGIEDSYRTNEESMFINDPILQWRPKPHYETAYKYLISLNPMQAVEQTYEVALNSYGFRGPEVENPKSRTRIVCLGDSVTFGLNAPEDFTYPAVLQQRLDAAAPGRVEVINAGVPSYSSDHGVFWLQDVVLPLEPDLVILGYGHNDSWMHPRELRIFMSERNEKGWIARTRKWLNKSDAYRVYKRALLRATEKADGAGAPDPEREFKTYQNYERMLAACRDADIPVLMLVLYHQRPETVAQLQQASQDFNVPLIDVRPTFEELELRGTAVMSEEKHPNTRGYGVMGLLIVHEVARALHLPQPPSVTERSGAPAGA